MFHGPRFYNPHERMKLSEISMNFVLQRTLSSTHRSLTPKTVEFLGHVHSLSPILFKLLIERTGCERLKYYPCQVNLLCLM